MTVGLPPIKLGPQQANVVISALTEYCISLGADVQHGDTSAIREQQIAMNLRDRIAGDLRFRGYKSRW